MSWQDDIASIQRALEKLPSECRYHRDKLNPRLSYREGCCDTGIPALRRRKAIEALNRLNDKMVEESLGDNTIGA